MRPFRLAACLTVALLAAACQPDGTAALTPPQEPGPDAIGTICRMALSEHAGPKGQVFLKGQDRPLWFSSVRDTFNWLLVEDGGGHVAPTIWVNDMAKSKAWDKPDAGAWVDARQAVFVANSSRHDGMGEAELVPFSDRNAAAGFAAQHGGKVLAFAQITRDVLAGNEPLHHSGHKP